MGILDFLQGATRGRRRLAPVRDTIQFPNLIQIGRVNQTNGLVYKATPRNLRYFSRTPYPRRAINTIKNPIKMLSWEVCPLVGVEWNSELERQAEIATFCFSHPNEADDFQSMLEQLLEDYLIGASALETQTGGDPNRPLWIWPTDGLSIQIYPTWDGDPNKPRYAQTIGYGSEFGGGQAKFLYDEELLYLRPNPNTATPFGFGPLEIAFNAIARLLSVAEFAGDVAGNRHPSIGLDFPGYSSQELQGIRQYWRNEIEGTGTIPFFSTERGADEKTSRINVLKLYPEGDEGLYLKYQEMLIRELGCAFDISAQNFSIERDVNRNTSEVAEDRDWDAAIKPCAHDVAKAFTRHCLHKKLGFSQLRFKFIGLEREDELATMEVMKLRYETNSITGDEIRDRVGQAPMESEWGDKTSADVDIAIAAARSAATVLDNDLPGAGSAKSAAAPKPKRKMIPKKGK